MIAQNEINVQEGGWGVGVGVDQSMKLVIAQSHISIVQGEF